MLVIDVTGIPFAEQMAALWEFAESFRQDWPAWSWSWGGASVFDRDIQAKA